MPPKIRRAEMTKRMVIASAKKRAAKQAVITGTASCMMALTPSLRRGKIVYQRM